MAMKLKGRKGRPVLSLAQINAQEKRRANQVRQAKRSEEEQEMAALRRATRGEAKEEANKAQGQQRPVGKVAAKS